MSEQFTVVFNGSIRKLDFNPHTADTPFGRAQTCGVGNAFAESDRLRAENERLREALKKITADNGNWCPECVSNGKIARAALEGEG